MYIMYALIVAVYLAVLNSMHFIGCTVTTTCGLGILPLNTFSRPIKILCIAEKEIEWLYPNFTVIANTKFNTTARFHGM